MAELLKNIFFTKESVEQLSKVLKREYPKFNEKGFFKLVFSDHWKNLELKEKMRHVSACMQKVLPQDFIKSVEILEKIAPDIKGFEAMTLPDYVEQYGMEYFDRSLKALTLFTKYSSSEFAIRPFIAKDPKKVMALMLKLADDEDERVRRFSSEGCRPRLPWAMALPELQKDPSTILPILEKLKNDPSEFVRRSVANNLNDISKDNPNIAIEVSRRWIGKSPEIDKIIKHGLRTLLKDGNTDALRLFGYGDPDHIELLDLNIGKNKIRIGENTQYTASFRNHDSGLVKLRLEYAIYYRKSSGGLSKKVFQVTEKKYAPGTHKIQRKLTFQDMTTRKHYPGEHQLSFIVNGKELEKIIFLLRK